MIHDPVVTVSDLTKRYGGRVALAGVSFDIERGEVFALLGPNGAGKSTAIEILEGYRARSGGDARVLGVDPGSGSIDWKARLGIVLQYTAEARSSGVREELAHFASFYPNPRDVDATLEAVGLQAAAKQRIRSLSGGQRRRLDVALGVIGRPELLFLDEPTTGFDPEARQQFWGLVRELKAEGTTILLTTHYLEEAAALSDRAAVLAAGQLVALGPVGGLGAPEARVPVVRWRDEHGPHEHRTPEPGGFVAHLVSEGEREPDGLEIVRPGLEDVYLGLIAHSESREERAA